jgi:probable F420-dependent oxidoreductase
MSGGRLVLGVGVGWVEEEFATLGVPFDDRGRRTDEYLQAMRALWSEERPNYDGETVAFKDVTFQPRPAQRPGPPILVAGMTPPAIRRAAQLGDGWHPIRLSVPELSAGIDRFRAACVRAGRPADLPIVYRSDVHLRDKPTGERDAFTGTAEEIGTDVAAYTAAGVTEFIFDLAVAEVETAEAWSAALNALAGILELTPQR